MSELMDLFDIVKERPITEQVKDAASCPRCRSSEVTLGQESISMDHHRRELLCQACGFMAIREWVVDRFRGTENVWYTMGMVILRGLPSCYERFVYACIKCDGAIAGKKFAKDSDELVEFCSVQIGGPKNGEKNYRNVYRCDGCGHGGETIHDHWWPGQTNEPPKPMPRALKTKWTVMEMAPLATAAPSDKMVDELINGMFPKKE